MKKLIPAICMTLIAAVMLASSTFAWFSMNTTVTASGMQVTANSNSVYLLISKDKTTASEIQAVNPASREVDLAVTDAELFPSAHKTVKNTTEASNVSNWYYKVADAPSASTSTGGEIALSSDNFAQYVVHKTVYITVAKGSNPATNLKVTAAITPADGSGDKTIAPVKVLVTTSTAIAELHSTALSSENVLAASISDDTVVAVDIFIYYNGDDSAVSTNNIANLNGATIALTFSVAEAA